MAEQSKFLAAIPALAVSDEDRATAFFVDLLGFERLVWEGEPTGILRRDEVELHVWVADGSGPGAERELAGSTSCRIQVTRVEDLFEKARSQGVVHPNAPLEAKPWGSKEFAILDPDGNLVTLFERTDD